MLSLFIQLLHLDLQSLDDGIQVRHVAFFLLFHKDVDGRLNLGYRVATVFIAVLCMMRLVGRWLGPLLLV